MIDSPSLEALSILILSLPSIENKKLFYQSVQNAEQRGQDIKTIFLYHEGVYWLHSSIEILASTKIQFCETAACARNINLSELDFNVFEKASLARFMENLITSDCMVVI